MRAFNFGFLQQNCDPHFQLGRLDGDGQPGREARHQPVLHILQLLRVRIARDDDLLAACYQRFERIEEFFLRTCLAGEKLDIVDQQQIERVVIALEVVKRLALIGSNHVAYVLLGMDVADLGST